jgi:hypothetical protein
MLADRRRGPAEHPQAAQEAAVGLVTPRHRALAAPSGATDRIEAAVIADARARIGADIVAELECGFGQVRPAVEERRIPARDLAHGVEPAVGQRCVERVARRRILGWQGRLSNSVQRQI